MSEECLKHEWFTWTNKFGRKFQICFQCGEQIQEPKKKELREVLAEKILVQFRRPKGSVWRSDVEDANELADLAIQTIRDFDKEEMG